MSEHPEDAHVEPEAAPPGPAPRNPLQIAWQRKPLVALGIVVGAVVAALVAAQRAPVYQSSAQVLVVKKFADAPLQPGSADPRAAFYEDYVSTHLASIRSQVVIDKAVKNGDLRSLPSFANAGNPTPLIIASLTASRDSKESGANNIINLTYKGPEAEDCRTVITAAINSYKEFLDEAYHNVSDETYNQASKHYDEIVVKLGQKNDEQAQLRQQAPLALAPTKDGVPASYLRLSDLENRRMGLLVRRAEIEERLKALDKAKKDGTAAEMVQVLSAAPGEKAASDNPLDQQLLPLLLEEQGLLRDYGEDHPQVRAVRKKIEMTREFLAPEKRATRLAGRPGSADDPVEACEKALRQELTGLKLSQDSLVELTAAERTEARALADLEIKDAKLRGEIGTLEQGKDVAIARLKAINEVRAHGGYDAKLISIPGPGSRTGTGMAQIILAGAAVGLLLGVGLAYLADMTDKSFRSPEEIRRRLGLPIVAHVPMMAEEAAPSSPDAPLLDRSLAIYHRPKSGEAEAARSLRTSLYFSTKGTTHKVIQITSPNMGDGKTTVASNLAIAIAQSGKRVVLVDGDMRRPRIHSMFGVRPEVGLSSVIVGEAPLSAALVESGIERLSLVTCGPRPENPAELLTQPRFEAVLEELRQQFDFVIVDTPPLLAVTDPAVVVSRMDGVFLVIRLSKNGRPAAERAREVLYHLQANVLGVVVNGVGRAAGAYGYEHYNYQYGYGGYYVSTAAETNGHAEGAAEAGAVKTHTARKRSHRTPAAWWRRWLR